MHAVFVVGAPRSGTTMLAELIGRAGDFASFRAESKIVSLCAQKYGPLHRAGARRAFRADWLASMQFDRSGLSVAEFDRLLQRNDRSWCALLEAFMSLVAAKQGKKHWIDSEPDNAFHVREIAEAIPNARFVNIVRDGRAVAASQERLGWWGLPVGRMERKFRLAAAALQWGMSVDAIPLAETIAGRRCITVTYEGLIENPVQVLEKIGDFIGIDIRRRLESGEFSLDTVRTNSAYGDQSGGLSRSGLDRWRSELTFEEIAYVQEAVGPTLERMGYSLLGVGRPPVRDRVVIRAFDRLLTLKNVALKQTLLGRLTRTPLPEPRPITD